MDRGEAQTALEDWTDHVREAGRRIVDLWYGQLPLEEKNRQAIAASFEEISRVSMAAAHILRNPSLEE